MKNKLLILLLFFSILLNAQTGYRNFTTKNGLPSNTLYEIYHDKNGFLWFGTECGLVRFDGINFKTYTVSDGLPDNEILKVWCDKYNRIWVVSYNSKICYIENGIVYNAQNPGTLPLPASITAFEAGVTDEGITWIHDQERINYLDSNSSENILSCKDAVLKIYGNKIFCNKYFFNAKGEKIVSTDTTSSYFGGNDLVIHDNMAFDYARNKIKIYRFTDTSYLLVGVQTLDKPIIRVFYYASHVVLLYARGGFQIFTIDSNSIKPQSSIMEPDKIFTYGYYFEDKIWMSTLNSGLVSFENFEKDKTNIKNNQKNLNTICCIDGIIYCGDLKGNLYQYENNELIELSEQSDNNFGRIIQVFKYHDKNYTLYSSGVVGFDKKPILTSLENNMQLGSFKSIDYDNNNFYFASSNGAFIFNTTTRDITPLFAGRATCILKSDDHIFIGTATCLIDYHLSDKSYDTLVKDHRIVKLLLSQNILWVQTASKGVLLFQNGENIKEINESNGLISNIVKNIYIGGDYAWIATNNGISRFHLKDFEITNFNQADGLPDNNVNDLLLRNDMLYMATMSGLGILPVAAKKVEKTITVYLEKLIINNHSYYPQQKQITLTHAQNNIDIYFAAPCLDCKKRLKYKYRINSDAEYFETYENNIQLINLNPGEYHLEVYAINNSNEASEQPLLLTIVIVPAFWQTIWFNILLIALLAALLGLGLQRFIKNLKRREKEKTLLHNQISDLQNKALSNQMNPHFIFNSLNSIQDMVLRKEEEKATIDFITNFAMLMREILENSKKPLINIEDEILFIERYLKLEQIRFNNSFSYEMIYGSELKDDNYEIPPMLLQPVVENCIKHGFIKNDTDKKINIYFNLSSNNNFIVIKVVDNGIGLLEAASRNKFKGKHQSTALDVISQRLSFTKNKNGDTGTIEIVDRMQLSGNENGTIVTINIPV